MSVEYKDYYKILGVPKGAKTEDVKKAYRRLARTYHPDLNKGADAERRFKEVNEAHEVLSDPEKRKRYDQLGANWDRFSRGGGAPGRGNFEWVFTGTPGRGFEGAGDLGGFSDFFRTFFGDLGGVSQEDILRGRRTNGRVRQRSGEDLEGEVEIPLAEAFKGTERSVEVRRSDGATRRLDVRIPAGVRDGQRIRLAGQGGPGQAGGPAGDMFLRVRVQAHPFFRREGDDLHADLPVALHEALLGAEVTVPTLKGRVTLKIPAETQNGRTIRLAGQGMPRAGGGSGDLFVTVKAVLPQKLTDEERACVEKIAKKRANEDVRSHLL
ncbi:MAG: DnaJ C-terminal domain-containing protein [Candidatus Limnocylindria bacterium]